MKKQKKTLSGLTKEQKQAKRRAQVRRQRLLLCMLPCLLLFLLLIVFRLNKKENLPVINEACESYRPDVERLAAQYGMSDYVDLLLALMMQESSGTGPDVMQSSEGAYNTEYPQEPGGITDTEYSIACGIQELKYAMERAEVSSPADMEHIKLALQAYNFGADVYLNYMEKEGYTSWSEESSEAFARMASGQTPRAENDPLRGPAGPWAYGDQNYPQHVLRYYHPESSE